MITNFIMKIMSMLFIGMQLKIKYSIKEQRKRLKFFSLFFPSFLFSSLNKIDVTNSIILGVNVKFIKYKRIKSKKLIIYLHGGGLGISLLPIYNNIASVLSKSAESNVMLVDYRIAPEEPYPSALDDSYLAYCWALENGYSNKDIFFCGDSAGGGLVLSLLQRIKMENKPMPNSAAVFSPWTNLCNDGKSIEKNKKFDIVLNKPWLDKMADSYSKDMNKKDPLISSLYGDLSGFPPLLIQCGSEEILLSDSQDFAKKAKDSGVEVTLKIWEKMQHSWYIYTGLFSISTKATKNAGNFFNKTIKEKISYISDLKESKSILIFHLIKLIMIVLFINICLTGVLLFFHNIFSTYAGTDITTHSVLLHEYSFLYLTTYIIPLLLAVYIYYPVLSELFSKSSDLSIEIKSKLISIPITGANIVLFGWIYSIFQIVVLIYFDKIHLTTFIISNLVVQITISLAAYASTYFVLDYYNKRIFFKEVINYDNNKYFSFEKKLYILFLALVLFPCSAFGVIIYFILITNDSNFVSQEYKLLFSIIFILLVLGFILTKFLVDVFKKSFKELNLAARKIQNNDYNINLEITSVDEIGKLMNNMNLMAYEINKLNSEIVDTQREVVFTMGSIGESRSKETGNHVKRVAEYSRILALEYGLSEEESNLLKQASPMHDIGKVGIPDAILNKPGRFTEEERVIMDTHAILGYEMLKHSNRDILKAAAVVAYEHHEKWDGTGYPRGLKGGEIHIYGRITAIADVFDALGSDRVYKKAWDDEKIFSLLREEQGKHFDPVLIDIFFDKLDILKKVRFEFMDLNL